MSDPREAREAATLLTAITDVVLDALDRAQPGRRGKLGLVASYLGDACRRAEAAARELEQAALYRVAKKEDAA